MNLDKERARAFLRSQLQEKSALDSLDSLPSPLRGLLLGGAKNFAEYSATINKALGASQGEEYWNKFRRQVELRNHDTPISSFAGEVLLDPITYLPGGVYFKGAKGATIAKSALAGAGVGAGTMALKNYGNADISEEQKRNEILLGAGLGGVVNGALSAYLGRKLSKATPATSSNPSTLSDEAKAEAIHRYFQKETPAPSSAPSPMPTNITPEAKPTTLAEMASRNPNFILVDEAPLRRPTDIPITIPPWVRNNAGISDKPVVANPTYLQGKHPETFPDEKSVFRFIQRVKEPTNFYHNNNPDIALMGKWLDDGALGKIGIVKDGEEVNRVAHLMRSSDGLREHRRLMRRVEGSPTPSLLLKVGVAHGAKAHSPAREILPPPSLESLSTSELLARIDPRLKSEAIDTEWNPIPLIGHKPRQDLESASTAELVDMALGKKPNQSATPKEKKPYQPTLFSAPEIGGSLLGATTGSQSDLNHDGEIDYKDMTLGALLGAVGAHGLAKAYRGEKVPIGLSIDDPKKANFFEGLGELPKTENLAPKILQRLDDAKIVDTLIGHKVYQNKGYMQARDNLHTRSVGAQEQPPPPRNLERIANREQRSGSRD